MMIFLSWDGGRPYHGMVAVLIIGWWSSLVLRITVEHDEDTDDAF